MQRSLTEILIEFESPVKSVRAEAAVAVLYLLEINRRPYMALLDQNGNDAISTHLPNELKSHILSKEEHDQIVEKLFRISIKYDFDDGALMCIGATQTDLSLQKLSELIIQFNSGMPRASLATALSSMVRLLRDEDPKSKPQLRNTLRSTCIRDTISKIAKEDEVSEHQICKFAIRALAEIDRIFAEPI